ncbi:hypothetical protein DESC_920052 [Desulfosarcina cetonica]|uniref:hypothetical protein n=1 Tax=Desulfosarcina cetonica TaxID=90730 RepID=UPI0006D222C0|nr:hypothetical protein [Desulfosarcina cetonica]VTR71313.1 hypothetical protein DESC_920052 [Desulfosarcina cetonica]
MDDETYFLLLLFFGMLFILVCLYRLLSNRYKPRGEKKNEKIVHSTALDMDKEFDDDVVTNPAFSSLKANIFHKDRYDDDK